MRRERANSKLSTVTWLSGVCLALSSIACELDGRDDVEGESDGVMVGADSGPNSIPDLTGGGGSAGSGGGSGGDDADGDPTGPDGETRCQHIDFLFVIDNSSSMADEQAALRKSVPGFVEAIKTELDLMTFNLGVVTTDEYQHNARHCGELGSLVIQSEAGTCGPYAHGKNHMTHADDLGVAFPCAASLGVGGESDERPMEAMIEALIGGLECNAGFVRDQALLVVTLLTDEHDDHEMRDGQILGSPGGPADWHQAVLAAKQGKPENVVALGLVGVERPNACPTKDLQPGEGAENSPRNREFINQFGTRGFVGDICEKDYGPFFTNVMSLIEQACKDFDPPA